MKKTLFGGIFMLSLVAFLATGCNTEKVETSGDDMITFNTAVGKQTRASEFETSDLEAACTSTGTPLIVHAYYQGGSGLYRTFQLTYDVNNGGKWSYGIPVRYPENGLIYYASYPDQGFDYNTLSLPYMVKSVGQQEDLIATSTIADGPDATLVFNHILSQINFAVKGATGYTITIDTPITLCDILSTGDYYFETGEWINQNTPAEYEYDASSTMRPFFNSEELVDLRDDPSNPTNALMLMPQIFNLAGGSYNLTFDYTITEDANPANTGSATAHIPLFGAEWEPGMRYLIVIDFSGDYIRFTNVEVGPWGDETEYTVIPNPADPE